MLLCHGCVGSSFVSILSFNVLSWEGPCYQRSRWTTQQSASRSKSRLAASLVQGVLHLGAVCRALTDIDVMMVIRTSIQLAHDIEASQDHIGLVKQEVVIDYLSVLE